MSATVMQMQAIPITIPTRKASMAKLKRNNKPEMISFEKALIKPEVALIEKALPKLLMATSDKPLPTSKLRPLPAGWLRQYDIIHKRYFYVDIRERDAPKSSWRFPAGVPISIELASPVQSVDIHRFNPPTSAPPPLARKSGPSISSVPVEKNAVKIETKGPIVVYPDARDLDLTYSKFIENMNAGESPILASIELAPLSEERNKKLPTRPRRKAVPEYTMNPVQSEFIKQLSDLDLESSDAANILLTLAFPDVIMNPNEADYDSLEERSSSGSSSSGHSFSDSGSAWTLDL